MPSHQIEATATGLSRGTYEVLVTDDQNCRNTGVVGVCCPDPSDSAVFYLSRDPSRCPEFLECSPSRRSFNDTCGCGCIEGGIFTPVRRIGNLRFLATSIGSIRGKARGGFEGFDSEVEIERSTGVSLGIEFALGGRLGVELAVLVADGDIETRSLAPSGGGPVGGIREQRSGNIVATSLGITYPLVSSRRIDVVLGAFLGTLEVPDPPLFEADGALGFGGMLGLEAPLGSRPWSLHLRLRYLEGNLDLTRSTTGERSRIELDPWITELGISYSF